MKFNHMNIKKFKKYHDFNKTYNEKIIMRLNLNLRNKK